LVAQGNVAPPDARETLFPVATTRHDARGNLFRTQALFDAQSTQYQPANNGIARTSDVQGGLLAGRKISMLFHVLNSAIGAQPISHGQFHFHWAPRNSA